MEDIEKKKANNPAFNKDYFAAASDQRNESTLDDEDQIGTNIIDDFPNIIRNKLDNLAYEFNAMWRMNVEAADNLLYDMEEMKAAEVRHEHDVLAAAEQRGRLLQEQMANYNTMMKNLKAKSKGKTKTNYFGQI